MKNVVQDLTSGGIDWQREKWQSGPGSKFIHQGEKNAAKGRVLRTGESQRKDLIYQYRYTDALGNRKCIYASDLKTLREKEDELQRSLEDGLDYTGGEITVYELLQRYLSLKCGVRYPWQTFQLHLLHKGRSPAAV